MINETRLAGNFIALTRLDSESGEEAPVRDYLLQRMQEWGYDCREDDSAEVLNGDSGNLLARIPGRGPGLPLLFSSHMDTVKPGKGVAAKLGPDRIIRSLGATILGGDNKAGIAAILEAVELLREQGQPHPPLELLFTVREEQGLLGARHFQMSQLQASQAYVLDSGGPPGSIVVQSPSQYDLTYRVWGKAAHAGMHPEQGLNAIHVMAQALAQIPCGRLNEDTTCNLGMIEGGQARNIVAAECWTRGEARSLRADQLEELVDQLEYNFLKAVEAAGAKGSVERTLLYSAVSYNTGDAVVQLAQRAAENIGLKVSFDRSGGGSDASVINQALPCLNLGIGMSQVHTVDEYIGLDDLVNTVHWILEIIRLAGEPDA